MGNGYRQTGSLGPLAISLWLPSLAFFSPSQKKPLTLEALAQPFLALWWDEGVSSDPMGAVTKQKPQMPSQLAAHPPLSSQRGEGLANRAFSSSPLTSEPKQTMIEMEREAFCFQQDQKGSHLWQPRRSYQHELDIASPPGVTDAC